MRSGVPDKMGDGEISCGSSVISSPSPSCNLDVSTGRLSTGKGVLERGGSGKWPNSSKVKSGTGDAGSTISSFSGC